LLQDIEKQTCGEMGDRLTSIFSEKLHRIAHIPFCLGAKFQSQSIATWICFCLLYITNWWQSTWYAPTWI